MDTKDKLAFDPQRTRVVVTAYPDLLIAPQLLQWLRYIGIPEGCTCIHRQGGRDVCAAYNCAVKIALQSDAEHFIFADKDIRPDPANTSPFLYDNADVVGAIYDTECERAFDLPDSIHCALWRCKRSVLESIEPPWFAWQWNKDGTAFLQCPCASFRRKAQAKGFTVTHAGWAQHFPRQKTNLSWQIVV